MKYVKFKRFGGKNFEIHTEPIELDVENGVTLVTGPNGVGKTSLFEIIPFTFFGKTTKGSTSNDVVNNYIGKDCVTFVDYDIYEEDGTVNQFRCTRYASYKSVGNSVVLSKNKEKKFKVGHKEVIKEINKLWSREIFLNTKFFAQKVKDFFMDLQDSDQKQIFKSILGTQDYETYKSIANKKEKECRESLTKIDSDFQLNQNLIDECNSEINRLQNEKDQFYRRKQENISTLENEINELRSNYKENEDNLSNFQNKDDIQNDIDSHLNTRAKYKSELDSLESSKKSEVDSIIQQAEYKKSELRSNFESEKNKLYENFNNELASREQEKRNSLKPIEAEIEELTNNKTNLTIKIGEIESEISNKDYLINTLFSDSENVINEDIDYCPTCKQEITTDVKEHLISELNELKSKKSNLQDQLSTEKSNLQELINQIDNKKQEISKIESENDENVNSIKQNYNQQVNELQSKLNESISQVDGVLEQKKSDVEKKYSDRQQELFGLINDSDSAINELRSKIKQIDQLSQVLNDISNKINLKLSELERTKSEEFDEGQIKYYENKLASCREKLSNLESQKLRLDYRLQILQFWVKGFSNSGIPSMLIDEAIPFMNRTIKQYLDLLSFGRYVVTFDTISQTKAGEYRDKINVNIYDNETKADQRKQLSGGQTRLIDIATILTLSDLQAYIQNVDSNLLIFDEVFDSLDDENIQLVSKSLRQLSREKSICIISHSHISQLESDNLVQLYK